MGDKSGGGGSQSNPSADLLAQLSRDLYNQTNPLRQALIDRSGRFLGVPAQPSPLPSSQPLAPPEPEFIWETDESDTGRKTRRRVQNPDYNPNAQALPVAHPGSSEMFHGGPVPIDGAPQGVPVQSDFDPTASFLYGPTKSAIESQYGIAKNNLIAGAAPGGAMTTGLANIEGQRARTLAAVISDITEKEYANAMSLATGGASQSMTGLGSAGAINAQLQAAEAARQASAKQGLGAGVGYLAGNAFGGPLAGMAAGAAVGGK